MLKNIKIPEVINFISTKVSDEEKNHSDDFNYYLSLAMYYEGKYDKAKQIITIINKRNNENPKYINLLEKITIIDAEKEKGKKNFNFFFSANEAFKKGDFPSAIELYTKLLEIDPENKNFNSTIIANRSLCKYYFF